MKTAKKREPYPLPDDYEAFLDRVIGNMRRRFKLPKEVLDDCRGAAAVGLLEAAERFDPNTGTPFFQFAFLRVRGAVFDHLRQSSGIPSRIYRSARVLEDLDVFNSVHLSKNEQQHSTELATLLEFAACGGLIYRMSYFDAQGELAEREEESTSPEVAFERKERRAKLRRAIERLPLRERVIIEHRYYRGKSFQEISDKVLNISRSWVSRLHSQAVKRLRIYLTEKESLLR